MIDDHMTKIEGIPSIADALPGMAYFANTGPYGKTCGDCKHRGMYRESRTGHWDESIQNLVYRTYRTTQCVMFKKLAGRSGSEVKKEYPACKYFEQKAKP